MTVHKVGFLVDDPDDADASQMLPLCGSILGPADDLAFLDRKVTCEACANALDIVPSEPESNGSREGGS